jgi:hypothetical protein
MFAQEACLHIQCSYAAFQIKHKTRKQNDHHHDYSIHRS